MIASSWLGIHGDNVQLHLATVEQLGGKLIEVPEFLDRSINHVNTFKDMTEKAKAKGLV